MAYFHWNGLIEEAFDFLDKLHKFYKELAVERSGWDAENRRREKEAAEALKLPDPVSVEKAMRVITDQRDHQAGDTEVSKGCPLQLPRLHRKPSEQSLFPHFTQKKKPVAVRPYVRDAKQTACKQKRKTGVPRNLVLLLKGNVQGLIEGDTLRRKQGEREEAGSLGHARESIIS